MIYNDTEFMLRRFRKLARLNEDETQDKLDDLSKAFKTDSVANYVALLQKYSSDPKVLAVLKAGITDGQPNDEKFGVENVSQSENIKIKKEKTIFEHFGVSNPLESDIVKQKIKKLNDFKIYFSFK